MVKFYDTNALLLKMESLFEEHFAISSVSLSELEKIKTSAGKSGEGILTKSDLCFSVER